MLRWAPQALLRRACAPVKRAFRGTVDLQQHFISWRCCYWYIGPLVFLQPVKVSGRLMPTANLAANHLTLMMPLSDFRSFMFEAVGCNDALADLFIYSNALDHPVLVSKLVTAHSCVKGRPHIYHLYRDGFNFLSASGYHYQVARKAPLVFILPLL